MAYVRCNNKSIDSNCQTKKVIYQSNEDINGAYFNVFEQNNHKCFLKNECRNLLEVTNRPNKRKKESTVTSKFKIVFENFYMIIVD